MTNVTHKFFSMYLLLFITLYNVSSTSCSSSGETNCINTASGYSHSMLVAEMCEQVGRRLIYKRVINRNKYIEKNLCITLVIYQESLHVARSTKCKKNHTIICILMWDRYLILITKSLRLTC